MKSVIITGSCGLIGSEAARLFLSKGYHVVGIDNFKRDELFGGSTVKDVLKELQQHPEYEHHEVDIKDSQKIFDTFATASWSNGNVVKCVIHAAGQPSHDYASEFIDEDFEINAKGTLNVLRAFEGTTGDDCVFIYTSTNKVYGEGGNFANKLEVDEETSIDQTTHSFFGVSKVYGDLITQEFGRYNGRKTVCFRLGCVTGKNHKGTEEHGFLSYLVKAIKENINYNVYGDGLQVRDVIHAADVAEAFWQFYQSPPKQNGIVYNLGGGGNNSQTLIGFIGMVETKLQKRMNRHFYPARKADHKVYVTNNSKFEKDFPQWHKKYDLDAIIDDLCTDTDN